MVTGNQSNTIRLIIRMKIRRGELRAIKFAPVLIICVKSITAVAVAGSTVSSKGVKFTVVGIPEEERVLTCQQQTQRHIIHY